MTVEEFAALVQEQTRARIKQQYPDSPHMWDRDVTQVRPGPKYTKVDVGPEHNMSGKYMIENSTGDIWGIKGYGVVHRGHHYGTLDTVDAYFWGGYVAEPRAS